MTTYAAAVSGALLGGLPEGSVDRLLEGHAAGSPGLEKLCRQVWALTEAMDETRPG